MKRQIQLLAAVLVAAFAGPACATTTVSDYVVRMTATADTYTPTTTKKVVGIKVAGLESATYIRLRRGSISGAIIWEHKADTAATTSPLVISPPLDAVRIHVGSGSALYLQSDAVSFDAFLYTE